MGKIILIICIILFICILISIIYCYIKIDISVFNVKNKKIDKNLKLLFLSDLHNRNIYKKIEKIINLEKPDIIICGGDMVNESIKKVNNFLHLIELFKNYKTYYTYGNHEEVLEDDEYEKYTNLIKKTSLILLNSTSDNLSKNIKIYGLNNGIDTYQKFGKLCLSKEYIEDKIGEFDNKKYNILIAHNPLEFASYVQTKADLVLSGHVHGGLARLPFHIPLLSPDYTFLPKYSEGMYKKNNTTMIVSRGLGFSQRIAFRVNNPPEIIIVNLIKE